MPKITFILQQRCCVKAKGSQENKTRNSASGSGSTQSASLLCQLHNVKEPYLVDVLENEDGAVVWDSLDLADENTWLEEEAVPFFGAVFRVGDGEPLLWSVLVREIFRAIIATAKRYLRVRADVLVSGCYPCNPRYCWWTLDHWPSWGHHT